MTKLSHISKYGVFNEFQSVNMFSIYKTMFCVVEFVAFADDISSVKFHHNGLDAEEWHFSLRNCAGRSIV